MASADTKVSGGSAEAFNYKNIENSTEYIIDFENVADNPKICER
jgi:hypothetical protein